MKKIIICLILFFPIAAIACDICGCGVGNGYIGILPDFAKRIIGVRYRYNTLQTHLGAGGSVSYLTSVEKYHTAELWSGWNITNRMRLMISLPYNINERFNQGISKMKNGVGDISLSAFYSLLNRKQSLPSGKLLVQSLWLGGSIKLPTGEYAVADKSVDADNSNLFQLGTGSTDFSANIMYDVRLQDAGININAGYKVNTGNRYDYHYGNKFNVSAQVYHKFRVANKISLAPNAGIQYETANKDEDGAKQIDVSGGRILLATAGIETSFSRIMIGANYQLPITQRLANGFVKANNRWMVHCAFAF